MKFMKLAEGSFHKYVIWSSHSYMNVFIYVLGMVGNE